MRLQGFRPQVPAFVVAGVVACLLATASAPAEAGRGDRRAREAGVTKGTSGTASGPVAGTRRGSGRIERFRPRRQRSEPAMVMIFTAPGRVAAGEMLAITLRLDSSEPGGHHAAMSVDVDPAVLEYVSFDPTGRGALLVQPYPERPGVLAVYRSSLAEGFSPAEDLATLTFLAKGSGRSLIVLSDVRLLDGEARDMPVAFEAGEIYVE